MERHAEHALVAASASLRMQAWFPNGGASTPPFFRKLFSFLARNGYSYIPSEIELPACSITKRPVKNYRRHGATESPSSGASAGRPTWVRITVGTHDAMQQFPYPRQ